MEKSKVQAPLKGNASFVRVTGGADLMTIPTIELLRERVEFWSESRKQGLIFILIGMWEAISHDSKKNA
jgi:hypothetical protein